MRTTFEEISLNVNSTCICSAARLLLRRCLPLSTCIIEDSEGVTQYLSKSNEFYDRNFKMLSRAPADRTSVSVKKWKATLQWNSPHWLDCSGWNGHRCGKIDGKSGPHRLKVMRSRWRKQPFLLFISTFVLLTSPWSRPIISRFWCSVCLVEHIALRCTVFCQLATEINTFGLITWFPGVQWLRETVDGQ